MDITIKNVPEDMVEDVKKAAATTVERKYRNLELLPSQEAVTRFKASVDSFREDNGLAKKYEKPKQVEGEI